MQSAVVRSTVRLSTRPATASKLSRHTLGRRFASEAPNGTAKGDSTRSVPPNPAGGSSRLPFVIGGGVLFAVVAGRYILASDKPAGSAQAEQSAARREGYMGNRDPRDTGVKTLEQKKQQG